MQTHTLRSSVSWNRVPFTSTSIRIGQTTSLGDFTRPGATTSDASCVESTRRLRLRFVGDDADDVTPTAAVVALANGCVGALVTTLLASLVRRGNCVGAHVRLVALRIGASDFSDAFASAWRADATR